MAMAINIGGKLGPAMVGAAHMQQGGSCECECGEGVGAKSQGFVSASAHAARESASGNASGNASVSAGASVGASVSASEATAISVRTQLQGVCESSLRAARGFCKWVGVCMHMRVQ